MSIQSSGPSSSSGGSAFGSNGLVQTSAPTGPGYMTPAGVSSLPGTTQSGSAESGTAPSAVGQMTFGNNGQLYTQPVAQQAPTDSSNLSTTNSNLGVTPGQVQSLAPLPLSAFGQLGQINPTYAGAASIDPNSAQAYYNQYAQMLQQSLAPYNQQQDQQLQSDMAARGVQNSGTGSYLMGNLQGQQQANLAGQLAPMVSQAFGYQQNDLTGNAANQQQANIYNAGQANAATGQNVGYYNQALGQYGNQYNNYLNELFGAGQGQQNSLLSSYLNSFGPSTGVTNAMTSGMNAATGLYGNVYGSQLSAQQQAQQQAMQAAMMAFA